MFTMLQELGLRRSLQDEAPYFLIAFLIAEFSYKFKSFALECLGFILTWYVLSAVAHKIGRLFAKG